MPRGTLNCHVDHRPFKRSVSSNTDGLFATVMHDIYVSLFNTLDGPAGQSLGVVRRASNFGSTTVSAGTMMTFAGSALLASPGTGMGRWDSTTPAGENAWAVFEFTQASPKFWVLIQFSAYTPNNSARFGASQGTAVTQRIRHGVVDNIQTVATRDNSVGVMVAFNTDGSSPWLGTTNNNGADTRPTSPFSSSSCVFPRGNDLGGTFYYNRYCFMPLVHETSLLWTEGDQMQNNAAYDARDSVYHIVMDRDQLMFLLDTGPVGRLASFFYFGKFSPVDASNVAPYVCLMRNSIYDDRASTIWMRHPRFVYGSIIPNGASAASGFPGFGNYMRPDSNIEFDSSLGAADYRQPINGGVYDTISGHIGGCSLDMPTHMFKSGLSGSALMNNDIMWQASPTIRYEVVKPTIYLNDTPFSAYARLGVIDFFKISTGFRNGAYFADGNEVALGNPWFNNQRLVVPWNPNADYGVVGNRFGEVW